jgi:hypothetical protein
MSCLNRSIHGKEILQLIFISKLLHVIMEGFSCLHRSSNEEIMKTVYCCTLGMRNVNVDGGRQPAVLGSK